LTVAGIINHILCLLAFSFHRELTFFSELQLVTAPAATVHYSRQSLLEWRINKYHCVAQIPPARLEQQRGIKDDRLDARICLCPGDFTSQNLRNPGMNDLFQFLEGGLVPGRRAEDQPFDLMAINLATRGKDDVTEDFAKLLFDGGLLEDEMARCVSFNDFDAMSVTKQPGEMALSRAYASDQTDDRNSSRSILQCRSG